MTTFQQNSLQENKRKGSSIHYTDGNGAASSEKRVCSESEMTAMVQSPNNTRRSFVDALIAPSQQRFY
jgi:hypothetical protein